MALEIWDPDLGDFIMSSLAKALLNNCNENTFIAFIANDIPVMPKTAESSFGGILSLVFN